MSRTLLMMFGNPLIACYPSDAQELAESAKREPNTDTLRNVKAVVHVMEQLIVDGGDRLEGEDMRGISLILECVDHALEFELSKGGEHEKE